jgi:N-acetyl-anhydromuramyl-L-alanine amidase AmpD
MSEEEEQIHRLLKKLLGDKHAVQPSDLSKSLKRHPTKRYKVRKNESSIKRIVVHTTDRDWTIQQLVDYDVDGAVTYCRHFIDMSSGEYVDIQYTDHNHIASDGLPACTYHDVIMEDGFIYHTLPYREISWHVGGYNSSSVAVALMYRCTDPDTNKDTWAPNENMIKTLQCHCGDLCLKWGLTPDAVVGHRELKGTGWFLNKHGSKRLRKTCPGMQVNLDELRKNVAMYMQIKMKLADCYDDEIDGLFGNQSKLALKKYRSK